MNWTREQLDIVLELYAITPFGRIHNKNPEIMRVSDQIGRTASAVALKMANYASLDPTIQRSGMKNTSTLDRVAWAEFFDKALRFDYSNHSEFSEGEQSKFDIEIDAEGRDVVSIGTSRRGQQFFRRLVLASYNERCAITNIEQRELLVASHIVPWAQDKTRRLDPTNGICLCSLFDVAFDSGVVAVSDDLKVLISERVSEADANKLRSIALPKLRLPSRFRPDISLFSEHRSRQEGSFKPLFT